MKKLLLLSIVCFCGQLSFAQYTIPLEKFDSGLDSTIDGVQTAIVYENWFSPLEALAAKGGINLSSSMSILYPDSNVILLDTLQSTRPYWYSVGQTFDSRDENFELVKDGIRMFGFGKIEIDTIAFPYRYTRYQDSLTVNDTLRQVVDTLYLQFFYSNQLRNESFENGGPREIYAIPTGLDSSSVLYRFSTKTISYLLRDSDSTMRPSLSSDDKRVFVMALPKDLGQSIPWGEEETVFGMSITYKPMSKAMDGDTLEAPADTMVVNRNNYFEFSLVTNADKNKRTPVTDYYNHSFFTLNAQRYKKGHLQTWGFNDCVPGHAFPQNDYYFNVQFYSRLIIADVEEIENGYGVSGAYPNPAQKTYALNFVLPQAEEVSLQLLDHMGRIVKEQAPTLYNTGKHSLNMHVDDLKGGIYYYRLQAGDYTKSGRVVIP